MKKPIFYMNRRFFECLTYWSWLWIPFLVTWSLLRLSWQMKKIKRKPQNYVSIRLDWIQTCTVLVIQRRDILDCLFPAVFLSVYCSFRLMTNLFPLWTMNQSLCFFLSVDLSHERFNFCLSVSLILLSILIQNSSHSHDLLSYLFNGHWNFVQFLWFVEKENIFLIFE